MSVLRWLLWIFSMDCCERRTNRREQRLFILKSGISAILIGAFDGYSLFWKAQNMFSKLNASLVITDVVQMLYDYGQYLVDIYFVYKCGKEVSQEYFKNYQCIDRILGTDHQKEIDRKIVKLSSMLLMFWLFVSIFDFIAWFLGYSIWISVYYCLAYLFLLFKILTSLDMTIQIIHIEYRLKDIGDCLKDCSSDCFIIPEIMRTNDSKPSKSIINKNWIYNGANKKKPSNICHEIKSLAKSYLLLNDQCMIINKMFGIRVLLNILSLLIDMVRFLNIVVRITVGSVKTDYHLVSGYIPAVSTFLRFLICVFILASLVYHCEQAYAHTSRVSSIIDHIVVIANPEEPFKSSLTELRNLVAGRPISFNMANFFQLSYPFFASLMSVVVTYTIILLQSL